MNIETYIERIEQYRAGTLTAPERAAFEQELAQDGELREAYALYLAADDAIETGVADQLRQQMRQWAGQTAPAQRGGLFVAHRRLIRVAAASLALLLCGWFGLRQVAGSYTNEALFDQYYALPDAGAMRGDAEAGAEAVGFDLLRDNQTELALAYFEKLLERDPENPDYLYGYAHAAIKNSQWDKAINALQKAERRASAALAQKAAWNRALALLAAKRTDEFDALIADIAQNPDHSFQKQAAQLLKKRKHILRLFRQ